MTEQIVSREEEQLQLKKCFYSNEAEFIALYGRRRIGKTFLIKNLIEKLKIKNIIVTGLKDGSMHEQLNIFVKALINSANIKFKIQEPTNWMDAFELLTIVINNSLSNELCVVFLDELPWLATVKSGLIQALDHYWNTVWCYNPKFKLVVCGSAASWMIDNIINAKGGLHNRITKILRLKAFSLGETKQFLLSRNIQLNNKQILDLYMAIGGIPFYLKSIESGLSAIQNINNICFMENGILFNEFHRLYNSLFDNSPVYLEIMNILSKNRSGLNKELLIKNLKLSSSGGTLTKRLNELEEAGFIISFVPFGCSKKGTYYKIIDEYSYFYLTWIEPVANRIKLSANRSHYWQTKAQSQSFKVWSGYAFESVCYKHIDSIIKALNINSGYEVGTWRYIPPKTAIDQKGSQIDLIIDRDDGVINICEIKYSESSYIINKSYLNELRDKIEIFKEKTKITKQIFFTMITINGLLSNLHSQELVNTQITLDDLFT